ncbi:fibronectin type III domain-containing protein [bacterium]|nr:fibronectin type III domain-containing protein [bacterium]
MCLERTMRHGRWRAALLLAAVLVLSACGTAVPGPEAAGHSGGLPALARLDAAPDTAGRSVSLQEVTSIPSADFADASLGIDSNPPNLTITAALGRLGYALYQVGPFTPSYSLTELELFITDLQNDYFLYFGDWEQQRWAPVGGARFAGFSHSFGDGASRYISPQGYFYFAIVTDGGFVLYNHAELRVENLTPLPPPGGLSALAGDGSAELSWDSYPDSRADSIDVFYSSSIDMSNAVLSQSLDKTATQWNIEGLQNGELYFFALKARNVDGSSAYSALSSATPSGGLPAEFKLAQGLWPRMSGSVDGSGTTTSRSGPANLDGFNSVLLSSSTDGPNRTSPVIDGQGNVYALSRDGLLRSYSSDLVSLRYSFDSNAYAPEGKSFVCPPQAPCLDSLGNAYFVVAQKNSAVSTGYLFGVTPAGALKFQASLGALKDENARPYSSLNIAPAGVLVCTADGQAHPMALNQDGGQAWKNSALNSSIRLNAEPAFNADNGALCWPCTFDGFSIGFVEHCISLSQITGAELPDSSYRDLGTPLNLAGGCVLADELFIYPESGQLLLINSSTGLREDSYNLGGAVVAGPSRVSDSDYIVQPVPTDGSETDFSELRGVTVDTSGISPEISGPFWTLSLGSGDVNSRAAVDKDGRIYIADTDGVIWLASLDYGQPPVLGSNPVLSDSREADGENTFYFSSFALGVESAYIVSEQNRLIQIYNPLD